MGQLSILHVPRPQKVTSKEGWGLGCSPLASTATTNQQTGRPRCTTHKCNSCTLTTLAKQCKHTDILKEIGRYSKLRPRAREDEVRMRVWIFSLFLLSILKSPSLPFLLKEKLLPFLSSCLLEMAWYCLQDFNLPNLIGKPSYTAARTSTCLT